MSFWLEQAVLAVHLSASAAWFGALVYRLLFVDPKACAFFGGDRRYEHFALDLAHGMRGVVTLSLATVGLTGAWLLAARGAGWDTWGGLMAAKGAVFALAVAGFGYVSWVYWPSRVFAAEGEFRRVRRTGALVAAGMTALALAGLLLGLVARSWRLAGGAIQ